MTKNKRHKIYLSREESQKWLDDKLKELKIESYEELEELADVTDDFLLSSYIRLHLMVIINTNKL